MDFRNVLMAIVLSTIVLVVWATLFEAPIVEKQIVEAYDMLADEKDQEMYYDYLITNMLLYFDKNLKEYLFNK